MRGGSGSAPAPALARGPARATVSARAPGPAGGRRTSGVRLQRLGRFRLAPRRASMPVGPDDDLDDRDDDPGTCHDRDDPPGTEPFDTGDHGDRNDESGLDQEPGADDWHEGILRLLLVLRLARGRRAFGLSLVRAGSLRRRLVCLVLLDLGCRRRRDRRCRSSPRRAGSRQAACWKLRLPAARRRRSPGRRP